LIRDADIDWYRGKNPSIVEIDLSPSQFAELLTSMNVGDGVPCTIARRDGSMIDKPAESIPTEQEHVKTQYRDAIRKSFSSLRGASKRLQEILEKKTITTKDRRAIRKLFDDTTANLEANADYGVTAFEEVAEKVITEAKANVDNFVTTALTRLGLEHLQSRLGSGRVLGSSEQLTTGDEEE
jgi:hypothetical protein